MNSRRCLLTLAIASWLAPCHAQLFTESFEPPANLAGAPPNATVWMDASGKGCSILVTKEWSAHGTQSLRLQGVPAAANAVAYLYAGIEPQANLWIQADVRVDTNSTNGFAAVDMYASSDGGIPLGLRFASVSNGTYDVYVLRAGGGTTYTNLPAGATTHHRWTLGATFDTATTNQYSLYLDGKPLATQVPLARFTGSDNPNNIQLRGTESRWHVDHTQLFEENPIRP